MRKDVEEGVEEGYEELGCRVGGYVGGLGRGGGGVFEGTILFFQGRVRRVHLSTTSRPYLNLLDLDRKMEGIVTVLRTICGELYPKRLWTRSVQVRRNVMISDRCLTPT